MTHVKYMFNTFPDCLLSFLPIEVFWNIKTIPFQNHWLGSTDYIDNVSGTDILPSPTSIFDFFESVDRYKRRAIFIRHGLDVLVLFQRYTNEENVWAFGSKNVLYSSSRLDEYSSQNLKRWIETGDDRCI